MTDFNELILKHRGKVFAIIGGAPIADGALDNIKADIWISVNDHGVKLRECDYVVAMDDNHTERGGSMYDYLARYGAPIIGPQPWANYQLSTWPDAPRRSVLSGMTAAWCAWAMGAKAIVLVGMNGYDGKSGAMKDAHNVAAAVTVPVRSIDGGPLTEIFPEYEAKERFGHYKESPQIRALLDIDEKITIRVVKPTGIRGREYQKGEELKIMRHEVARQLHHKMVVEI